MNNKARSAILHTLVIPLVFFPNLALFPKSAVAQSSTARQLAKPDAVYEDYLYVNCLRAQFPEVRRDISDHTRAFDPGSGRNFAYDNEKKAWIDTKTLKGVTCPRNVSKNSDPVYEDYTYVNCLRAQFPGVRRDISDHTRAFDPDSGRNFAWDSDKQTWIDTKTLECICPKCPPTAAQTTPTLTPSTPQIGLGTPVIDLNSLQLSIDRADNETAGVPKPSEETQKAEEKKTSFWESLVPALIPSIGIGVGNEGREKRLPNPCSPK